MEEFFWSLETIDSFTVYVLLTLVLAVTLFIREIVGSGMMATLATPLLIFGGLLSHYLCRVFMLTLSYDKDSNQLITVGLGVFVALVAMILGIYLMTLYKEWRAKITKPLSVRSDQR